MTKSLPNKISTLVGVLAVAMLLPLFAQAATEVVSGDTYELAENEGWLFNRDDRTATAYEFNADEASIGDGAVYAGPITNTNFNGTAPNPNWDKFIAEYIPDNVPIADLESFSYDFLIGAGGAASDENEFYLNVYMNFGETDESKFYDCRYNVVPTTGSTADWTTVTFDPTQTYPVATGDQSWNQPTPAYECPDSPADMESLEAGSYVRAFALNMGDTSANDTDLDGYFDNVVYTTTDGETVFDFDPFVRSAEITAPEAGEEVSGVVDFAASLVDEDEDDNVQWAVRAGTCAAGTNTVAGNVDGFSTPSSWDGADFSASVDMTLLPDGDYCFIFNPTESSGDTTIRLTQEFVLTYPNPEEKNQCMKGGWEDFGFKNQGQCVRFVETGKDSR